MSDYARRRIDQLIDARMEGMEEKIADVERKLDQLTLLVVTALITLVLNMIGVPDIISQRLQ